MISVILIVLGLVGIAFFLLNRKSTSSQQKSTEVKVAQQPVAEVKKAISYGPLYVLFGSQTGTAAKMAESFAQEAEEHGFIPEVIDLKNCEQKHFSGKTICIFFLSNTGEGDAPDNTVQFMKTLKQTSQNEISFSKCRFSIFGLGNTQYQHYNKVAKDVHHLLTEKHKAAPVFRLGLGDNNASLEDDYLEWKAELWPVLKKSSTETVVEVEQEEHKTTNNLATWRFVRSQKKEEFSIGQEWKGDYELDFLTESLLKSREGTIKNIVETRQNTEEGSSLQIDIEPVGDKTYGTAQNMVIYPENDPEMVKQVAQYFKLDMEALYDVQFDKKVKLPFCTPIKMGTLLRKHIDLQRPVIKDLLKRLAKLHSSDFHYFLDNSAPKSTKQFSKISSTFNYLFKLVVQHQIQMTFETFVTLSDPIAPRFYTIASSPLAVPDSVQIVASLQADGLCSKFFNSHPKTAQIEIRSSTFDDAMKNDRAIMIGAGVGYAPFRAYLQEKEVLMGKGQKVPQVTLYFGCRHEDGDFIYREDIKRWIDRGIINKFYPAFSRDQAKKVYVQDRMVQPEAQEQLYQALLSETSKIYCCGSVAMGTCIKDALTEIIKLKMSLPEQEAKAKLLSLQKTGKTIMELW